MVSHRSGNHGRSKLAGVFHDKPGRHIIVMRVEVTHRLIKYYKVGRLAKGAYYGHTLLLPHREPRRGAVDTVGDAK